MSSIVIVWQLFELILPIEVPKYVRFSQYVSIELRWHALVQIQIACVISRAFICLRRCYDRVFLDQDGVIAVHEDVVCVNGGILIYQELIGV